MESEKLKIYQNRLLVADLIKEVLIGKISVSMALSSFPKEKNDINIKCAFDALMHREADEEYRKKVADYAQVQDDFLLDLANILKENEKLPQNIIEQYQKYHAQNLMGEWDKPLKSILKNFKRMINF
ncbi:MAG: hypothetical protein IJB79_05965 [Candidatus Gastranaerophilales bacterium]|nr:hypothetical protein [Candidatus Gastranaerophilales bacterium]